MNIYETTSRNLEQFLYMHDIRHVSWRKDNDGMTVWKYELTPETERVINEYRNIIERRRLAKVNQIM